MNEQEHIAKALSSFLQDYTGSLARILGAAAVTGRISCEEVEKLLTPGEDLEEVLLLGYDWRILLPVRSSKSMEWGDRVFLPMPGEEYEFPNVVKYLVREAAREGTWEPGKAVAAVARDMGEPAWDQIPRLVEILGKKAEGNHVTAIQIKQACNAVHLGERVDSLIADLKACGILSPSLGYLPEAARKRSPVYELNPCLFPRNQD
ncbi:MAG: hypothetical protein DRN37_07630 [Thermoplasmata archaeon]|nr:MAG: hypothetical protein DRG82_12425 [Deltaproteobacteria bacterium]RLF56781.1 MAG: hypothetical protein DRN37_07630 [Thermoplasmata archaeon]